MQDRSSRPSALRLSVLLFVTAILTLSATAGAVRGRPIVSGNTVLSDLGTPLRGLRYSLDFYDYANPTHQGYLPLPDPNQIANLIASLPGRGINALHVYAETSQAGHPAGYNRQALQDLVNLTAANGLYLVITVGGQPDLAWTRTFWSYYAPVFKDSPNVIFELQNEPWIDFSTWPWRAQPSPADVRQFEADAYEIVRQSGAVQTPVLLFSYAFFHDGAAVLADVQEFVRRVGLETPINTVDWSRTAIAFHGYSGAATTQATMATVRGQGYGVMETEMACFGDTCPPGLRPDALFFPLLDLYEGTRASWFSFLEILVDLNSYWNQTLTNAGAVWAADAGMFPGWSDPPLNAAVTLLSPVNGKYVRLDPATNELVASATQAGAASFSVVPRGRYVALRVPSTGKYVQRVGTNHLAATATTPQDFDWIHRADGRTTLQAVSNWRFTSADFNLSSTPPLVADRARGGGPWEGFTVQLAPSYEGFHDWVDCFGTGGWAWDRNLPNGAITVDVYDGTTLLGSPLASQFRQDLLNAGKGNGYHGFTFSLPNGVRNGGAHSISVKYGGTPTLLGNSPKSVTCPAAAAHVIWLQPQALAGFGTPGSLVMAGSATGAPPGTMVSVSWRDVTAGGAWRTEPYTPIPDANGIWYHEILMATYSDKYAVYATYSNATSATCTYPGYPGGGAKYTCP